MFKKIILFLLTFAIFISVTGCGKSKITEININDYVSVEIKGNNGHAKAEVVGLDKLENKVLESLGEDAGLITWAMIQNKIDCNLDKFEQLSNGDIVELSFEIDNEYLEAEYNLHINSNPIKVEVSELEDKKYMELNPFEYYEYVINGESPYLTVTLMNNDDFGIGGRFVIDYPVENIPFLKNGDTVKVRFEYEADMAEDQCVMVLDGYKEISVKNYPNNAVSVDEIPESNWGQLMEAAKNLAEKTATTDFILNQNIRYKAYSSVENAQIKDKGYLFFKPILRENSTKIPSYNACFFVYEFTALNVETNMPEKCYLVLTAYDIKTDDVTLSKDDVNIFKIFNDWDALYNTCMKANKEQFIIDDNIVK